MSKLIIYGAGLLVVAFVVGLLLFLTFENASSGQAVYGTRYGSYFVSGPPSILVNLGILGMVVSAMSYIGYLFNRSSLLAHSYKLSATVSGVLIGIGLAWAKL